MSIITITTIMNYSQYKLTLLFVIPISLFVSPCFRLSTLAISNFFSLPKIAWSTIDIRLQLTAMEFQDPLVQETTETPHDKTTTEQTVEKLELEIDLVYSTIETNLSSLWNKTSTEAKTINDKYLEQHKQQLLQQLTKLKENPIKDNLKGIEEQLKGLNIDTSVLGKVKESVSKVGVLQNINAEDISKQANNALDTLDSHLEQVEATALGYVKALGSFWGRVVSVEPEVKESPKETKEPKETLFVSPMKYGTSRYDQDLYKLHTDASGYKDSVGATFNVESRTDEIAELLKKYPQLNELMHEIVPVKLAYPTFWYQYFEQLRVIQHDDDVRKKLTENDDGEEEFDWDEEEETGDDTKEEKEVEKEVEVKEKKEEKVEAKKEKVEAKEEKAVEDEDEDDDWEWTKQVNIAKRMNQLSE